MALVWWEVIHFRYHIYQTLVNCPFTVSDLPRLSNLLSKVLLCILSTQYNSETQWELHKHLLDFIIES